MATVKVSDEAFLAFFQVIARSPCDEAIQGPQHVGAVGNLDGDLGEADAAEERLVEEMWHLGRDMFGKTGVFCDAVMFGMVTENTLYFQVDEPGDFPGSRILSASQLRRHAETSEPIPCPSLRAKRSNPGAAVRSSGLLAPHML